MWKAKQHPQMKIAYFHFEQENLKMVLFNKTAGVSFYTDSVQFVFETTSSNTLLKFWISLVILEEVPDVVVLDGIPATKFRETPNLVRSFLNCYPNIKLIICTSQQLPHMRGELAVKRPCEAYYVFSWNEEELRFAYDILKSELSPSFPEMFYYCGYSIRWLCKELKTIIEFYDMAFLQVTDPKALLEGSPGEGSTIVVNSLMASFSKNEFVPVSEYITKHLVLKSSKKLVKLCKSVNSNNLTWLGWVFELEILYHIKKGT